MNIEKKLSEHSKIINNHKLLIIKISEKINQLKKEKNRTESDLQVLLKKEKKLTNIQKSNKINEQKLEAYKIKSLENLYFKTDNSISKIQIFEKIYKFIGNYSNNEFSNINDSFINIFNIINKLNNKKIDSFLEINFIVYGNLKMKKKYLFALYIITGNLIVKEYFNAINNVPSNKEELIKFERMINCILQCNDENLNECFKETFLYDLL